MIDIELNLLSLEKKKRLERVVRFVFIKHMLASAAIVSSLIAITLLWSWMVMIDQFSELSQSANLLSRDYSGYNKEVRNVNASIRNLNKSSEGYARLSKYILEIAETLPNGIKINSLKIDKNQNNLILTGTARTRDDLLNYQEVLNQIPWAETHSIPKSQLLKKEDINFEYNTKLK